MSFKFTKVKYICNMPTLLGTEREKVLFVKQTEKW